MPAPTQNDCLDQRIAEAISNIQSIEHIFSGAIIIHNIADSSVVYMSEWGRNYLRTTMDQIREMGTEFHNHFFNIVDFENYAPKIFGLLERNNDEEFVSFFQQVRCSPHHDWCWFLSATKIFFRDEHGKPLLTLTNSLPTDAKHSITAKAQRLLEENKFLRRNHHVFGKLTNREKEILKMMALGDSSCEMAEKLYISETTASTHRRNIKRKLSIETNYDITRFAMAFDLI